VGIHEEKAWLEKSIAECEDVIKRIADIKGFGYMESMQAIQIVTTERDQMKKRLNTIIKSEG